MTHGPKTIAAAGLILAVEMGAALSAPVTQPTDAPAATHEMQALLDIRPSRPVWMLAWTSGAPQAITARALI
jgi:hypothetical protein